MVVQQVRGWGQCRLETSHRASSLFAVCALMLLVMAGSGLVIVLLDNDPEIVPRVRHGCESLNRRFKLSLVGVFFSTVALAYTSIHASSPGSRARIGIAGLLTGAVGVTLLMDGGAVLLIFALLVGAPLVAIVSIVPGRNQQFRPWQIVAGVLVLLLMIVTVALTGIAIDQRCSNLT